jgi:ABC-type phosphate transport system substrate-binding protein
MKKLILSIILLVFIGLVSINAQSYKVIVNASNSTTSISQSDIADYFLKKKTKWSSGATVLPIDQVTKSSTRAGFCKELMKKSVSQVQAYWQQAVFAGKGTPPRELNSDEDVVNFVKNNPGAIGYVSGSANTSGVKVVTVN